MGGTIVKSFTSSADTPSENCCSTCGKAFTPDSMVLRYPRYNMVVCNNIDCCWRNAKLPKGAVIRNVQAERFGSDAKPTTPHHHVDENGFLVKCYHKSVPLARQLMWFVLGSMAAFPIEHGIYKFLPGFKIIGAWFGM